MTVSKTTFLIVLRICERVCWRIMSNKAGQPNQYFGSCFKNSDCKNSCFETCTFTKCTNHQCDCKIC
ncbi:hypothetical protein N665_1038s0010 [Sinapis alba]|nr:hypothetical protein N665_1038s0010 [Sinapis alba]